MYSIKIILHYLKLYKKQYFLLGIQMTVAFALIFIIRSSEISLELRQADAESESKVSFLVEAGADTDTKMLSELINRFIEENAEFGLQCIVNGNLYIVSSDSDISSLFGPFRLALQPCGEQITITYYDSMEMMKSMGNGIAYFTNILKIIMVIVTLVAAVGFTGYVMLTLLQREHDILAAYLCGASLKKLLFITGTELIAVGTFSLALGCGLGYILTPTMSSFGASGIGLYRITPQPEAFLYAFALLIVIYAIPILAYGVRMRLYDPLVQIRKEEN